MATYLSMRVKGKKMKVHRAVMEQSLGRKLRPDEFVHHINGDKHDNRIENLTIMSPHDHGRLHNQKYPAERNCVVCGKEFVAHAANRKNGKVCSIKCMQKLLANRIVEQLSKEGTLIREWDNIREAARTLNVSHSNILACCNGRQKSCKGYVWRYK